MPTVLFFFSFDREKIASSKKKLLIFFTEISGIGLYWYNKYARGISEKSLKHKSVTESRSNSAVKLFWNFKNKLLSGRGRHPSMFAYSENKSRLPIVLFFKRCFIVLEAPQIAPNLALTSNDLFLDIFKYPLAVLVQTPATYILMYCNACSTAIPAVHCFQLGL